MLVLSSLHNTYLYYIPFHIQYNIEEQHLRFFCFICVYKYKSSQVYSSHNIHILCFGSCWHCGRKLIEMVLSIVSNIFNMYLCWHAGSLVGLIFRLVSGHGLAQKHFTLHIWKYIFLNHMYGNSYHLVFNMNVNIASSNILYNKNMAIMKINYNVTLYNFETWNSCGTPCLFLQIIVFLNDWCQWL